MITNQIFHIFRLSTKLDKDIRCIKHQAFKIGENYRALSRYLDKLLALQVPDQDADAAVCAGVPPLTADSLLRLQLPQNCRKGELIVAVR